MRKLSIIIFFLGITSICAQDINSYIELLRSDVKTGKKEVITEFMEFTEEEASIFWNLYREYEYELDKLGDERVDYIKDFAENYFSMTDEKADKIMERAFNYQEEKLDLKKDFYKKLKKKLNASKAAMYIQLEHLLELLIDLQINSELPLLHEANDKTESK